MIEIRVSAISDNGAEGDGVIFVFDQAASDADRQLLDRALQDLGARTAETGRRPRSGDEILKQIGAFKCPKPPTADEIETYEAEGREAALKPDADPYTRFTDGLGALGVGSWNDGPASYRQRGFRRGMEERRSSGGGAPADDR